MIQSLEDMLRRVCAYGLEFKDSDGFTNNWCTIIPALELAYKISMHTSTGKTPEMFEKGWNPKLPVDSLKKCLVDIHQTASSFELWLDELRHHAKESMTDVFEHAKQKWDKSHKNPDFKVGDLILVSTLNFNNIKGLKKLKDSLAGPFIIKALHEKNAVQELLPLRNETPLEVPPLEKIEDKKVLKVLKERRIRGKDEREYLVKYKNPQHEDECIVEENLPDSQRFLRRFRHERRPIRQSYI
ncbi:hypothetical protein O181_059482 [Austropuccinia psidii MF-1]|uniref:Integrase catalytic domain-containing protein n=1 Tax=Austropuccinia psidii MF-1 TaxID=1389203 RepID=A0A9Q3ELQ8_9BASI|nr:hypothetical protein [Austropuccinia psidii MF-1]